MDMTYIDQQKAAAEFAQAWKGRGDEKQDTQVFWIGFLSKIFGIRNLEDFIRFEKKVPMRDGGTRFIDGYIAETKVLIEQKGLGINLDKKEMQSGGELLTPFEQALRYNDNLPHDEKAYWIITCNFGEFNIYNMNEGRPVPVRFELKDLELHLGSFSFIQDSARRTIDREQKLSMKAGEIVGSLYDALRHGYAEADRDKPETAQSLNVLCVRLVFCLYADDIGLFIKKNAFQDYLKNLPPAKARQALIRLFQQFDTRTEDRDPYDDELNAFPYVNGGLFADGSIVIPPFTDEILHVLLDEAAAGFDWSGISPTIFGAVFESTLDSKKRHDGGMHYTSVENIHKVIDPLFLSDLEAELDSIRMMAVGKPRNAMLLAFQEKLASIKVMDPAAGSGNFLTETYLCFRRMENECIRLQLKDGQGKFDFDSSFIHVSIQQFFGIEINDFAVAVARTALWIAESQMMEATSKIVGSELNFFPLKAFTNIHEGNALSIDWKDVVRPEGCTYIIGNPPFIGASVMSREQKSEMLSLFPEKSGAGDLDYVAGWYAKCADYIQGTGIRCAFVSTNSITQGSQVPILWKFLMQAKGINIDFAYRTFIWNSEATDMAHVHCVIIGFSSSANPKPKMIFHDGEGFKARNINGYLLDANDIFIESRTMPICNVLPIVYGNKPTDGGNLFLKPEEAEALSKSDPGAAAWIRPVLGSEEFLNGRKRYCLWLKDSDPGELRRCPHVLERIDKVRNFRLGSSKAKTVKDADSPMLFQEIRQPESGNYIIVPRVSSQRRRYIPMGFCSSDVIASDAVQIIPGATQYEFGVLESSVHMAWMRAICGRLKSDYRYSNQIVYNNFPWPSPSEDKKAAIERTGQEILDARALYPDSTLADLYDPLTMPEGLRKAHQSNDRAVMAAYGFKPSMSEEEIVSELFRMYRMLTEAE